MFNVIQTPGPGGKNLCPPMEAIGVTWAIANDTLLYRFNHLDVGTYTFSLDVKLTQRNNINDGSTCGFVIGNLITRNNFPLGTADVGDTVRAYETVTITESNKGTFTNAYLYGCGKGGVGMTGKANIENFQIEEGSTVTSYEPYIPYKFFGNIAVPSRYQPATSSEPTKFPMALEGLGRFELNGDTNENWTIHTSIAGLALHTDPRFKVQTSVPYVVLCDKYDSAFTIATANLVDGQCCGQALSISGSGRFCMRDSAFTDVNTLKAKLAADPMTIYFPLANPTGTEPRWNFVKDTKDNVFGYLNKATGVFVKAFGATGTQSSTVVYDSFMLKGGDD